MEAHSQPTVLCMLVGGPFDGQQILVMASFMQPVIDGREQACTLELGRHCYTARHGDPFRFRHELVRERPLPFVVRPRE